MWAELGHCHFLYVPAVLNVITNGNGIGTKYVLKWNRALGFEFSIQFSVVVRYIYLLIYLFIYMVSLPSTFLVYSNNVRMYVPEQSKT